MLNVPLESWFGLVSDSTFGFDGAKLLDATDDHLPSAGGVGVWTKSDAASSFDDLKIQP